MKSRIPRKRLGSMGQALTWPYLAAIAVVCLLTYGAGLWWVAQSSANQQREQAIVRLEMLADHLSSSLEPLLASGELSAVRRLVSEAGYQQQLDACRVLLGDGQTLVDANLEKPQLTVMPATWPSEEAAASGTRVISDSVQVEREVPVAGKGQALLTLSSTLAPPTSLIKPVLPGAVLIGLLGLAFGALVLRKMQGRLAVLTLIRGALRDAGSGMPNLVALKVNPAWGAEAQGWNRLVGLTETRQREEIEQTLNALNARSGGGTLEEACEGLGQGVLLADARGKVVYFNGTASATLGLDRDDTLDKPSVAAVGQPGAGRSFRADARGERPGACPRRGPTRGRA
ncbi:MAG: PAS domain-containing protein [Phycisphaeraceae bacterium]|nr:PAS domain-containing protein [Phycisphaeraceae bacterium]